jgi:pimeloyl-ACP methyl ester carboxylesterase
MSHPIFHFVHANSFPAETYRQFFRYLAKDYDVQALPLHAHNQRYPVRDGWCELADELKDILRSRYSEPVILVGHSLGGILAMKAAHASPGLARCVVMLDSPIVAGWRAWFLRITKLTGTDILYSPARFSVRRRKEWPDAESAYRHFASKEVFSRWPPEVLKNYVEHGTQAAPGCVRLTFLRDIETAVYRTLPHHLGSLVRRPFPVPIGFIGGRQSVECRLAGLGATRRLVGRHFEQIDGGHLFPMEYPVSAAMAVHRMIQSLLSHHEDLKTT